MEFFKKLKLYFLPKKSAADSDKVAVLMEMPYGAVRPSDLLEPLSMAIVLSTGKPVSLSISEIKAYDVFSKINNSFKGSCYALKHGASYYGSFIASNKICRLDSRGYKLKETNIVSVPIKSDGCCIYFLIGDYTSENEELVINCLKKQNMQSRLEETTLVFPRGTDLQKAIRLSEEYL